MENGKVTYQGSIDNAIEEYLSGKNNNSFRTWSKENAPCCDFLRLLEVKVVKLNNEIALNHAITDEIKIEFIYEVLKENQLFTHGFNLFNSHDIHILSSHDKDSQTLVDSLPIGIYSKAVTIPGNFLAEGGYSCSFAIMRYNPFHVEFHELDAVGFNVIDEIGSKTARGNYSGGFPGIVRPLLNWK